MELQQKTKTDTNGLIPPYGGELKNLIIIPFKYFHTSRNTATIAYIAGSNAFKITFNRI